MKGLNFPRKKEGLTIEVPAASADTPRFRRIGIIAFVGFAIGVLWPRLAGVQLVPRPPSEDGGHESASAAPPKTEARASAGPSLVKKAPQPASDSKPQGGSRIIVRSAEVTSCRDRQGKERNDCGTLNLDGIAGPRIQALRDCSGAEDARGTLSLGLEADFRAGRVARVLRGKSTTLSSVLAKRLAACAEKEFESASLDRVEHEHSSYTVFYIVDFLAPAEAGTTGRRAEEGPDSATAASGRATVGWQVALIRAQPEDGEVVARILSGTNVVVTARQGDWYRVKYDAKGSEGWVFKSAIGL